MSTRAVQQGFAVQRRSNSLMKRLALLSAAVLSTGLVVPGLTASAATTPKVTNGCVTSVPDAGSSTPQKICYTLFQPAGTDAGHRVPPVFHSHGWGGSRTT